MGRDFSHKEIAWALLYGTTVVAKIIKNAPAPVAISIGRQVADEGIDMLRKREKEHS